ncbi:MAG TPA: OmpA family protein [Saprospiraceae bacterium]|nr:OmpA family protein [Saprospiraceae bacterium]
MKQTLTILLTFFCFQVLSGQQQQSLELASNIYHEGEVALLKGKYKKAIRLFNKALRVKPDLRPAQRGIGMAYDLQKMPREALKYYIEVLENDPWFSRVLYYQVAEAYYKLGAYDEAIFYFEKFDYLQAENDTKFTVNGEKERIREIELSAQLNDAIRACQISMDSASFRRDVKVLNLGPTINSRADEYFPFLSNDQTTLFYTKRKDRDTDENLYISLFEKGRWRNGKLVDGDFNTDENEGMCTMVRDGRKMYFTACNRDQVDGPCDIWEATVTGTEISLMQPLRGEANTPAWESQAAVSCDGRTLYFASMWEGPGHQGGADIWYAKKLPSGLWSAPINMGPRINTPKDEESPFITNDGKALYFCSTGHLGLGSADIFMTMLGTNNEWTMPINLGPKVNSPYEELGFFLSADGSTGYFASDRPGGYGGKDIYRVLLSDELTTSPVTFVEGFVKDAATGAQIQATITINEGEKIRTDRAGRFFLCLPANYELHTNIFENDDYHPWEKVFYIPESDNRSFYGIDLPLRPVDIPAEMVKGINPDLPAVEDSLSAATIAEDTLEASPVSSRIRVRRHYQHSVFFKFDSADAENSELLSFDAFLSDLQGKEIISIEINGYADDIGEDFYNLELSEKRAKRIALYLYEKGLVIDNISMKGFGSVNNDFPNERNRRVDLKITTLE